jgi:ribosomal 50S subunit-associated protein YjgA (DUF615 family)
MSQREEKVSWKNASSLEEWVEKMIRAGDIEAVTKMMEFIPKDQREKYREIWRRVNQERKRGK